MHANSSPTLSMWEAPPVTALRADGTLDPLHSAGLSDDLAVALYEHMVLARSFDERLVALQRAGTITQYASAAGEEAAIVGAAAAMHDDDWIFPSARELAAALWRGMPLGAYAHHAFGTVSDSGKGRDAPGPPCWKAARVACASPLVATQIPHAVGVAWAARLRRSGLATLVFFGEGATSSGDFHVGLNFAGVTRAPVIAVCRNNGFALSTPADAQTASTGFAVKAVAYGLHGVRVDGTDVLAVRSVVAEARARALAGGGGTLVEALLASAAPDGAATDPLPRMRRYLEARGLGGPVREERLAAEIAADVERALADAARAAKPARETMFDDVYAVVPWHLAEQRSSR
jgi:2-oxoisovalerate dehydrogenase E1 component alpha subunit